MTTKALQRTPDLQEVLRRFLGERAAHVSLSPYGEGLINDTYLVSGVSQEAPFDKAILQRVNPIFGIQVHTDIQAITSHLHTQGILTPLLLPAKEGHLALEVEGGVYRMLTYIPGHSPKTIGPRAKEAGRLVGRFHAALFDLEHRFSFERKGAHDLQKHLGALREVCRTDQPLPEGFLPLAQEILQLAEAQPTALPGPLRICHGDLKVSNLRFDEQGRGLCLLDLDTLAHLPLAIELGDALRSWCNASPLGEDDPEASFDLAVFADAIDGYAEFARGRLTSEEVGALVLGVERIALQLAARFATDVVRQSYFRFDRERFGSSAAHNLVRGKGQLSLARGVARVRAEAEAIVQKSLG